MTRRYRMTNDGEQPVWASVQRVKRMAREDAASDHRHDEGVRHVGNLIYDEEYRRHRSYLSSVSKERDQQV